MLLHRFRLAAMTLMALGAVGVGPRAPEALGDPRGVQPAPKAARSDGPAPGRMFVVGRVFDPAGKPVPGASVIVRAAPRQPGVVTYFGETPAEAIGRARADASGRFLVEAPRVSSSRDEAVGALAVAPGFGAGWVVFDPDADRPDVTIRLRAERVLRGRLLDPERRPAVGVRVAVEAMGRPVLGPGAINDWVDGPWRPAEGPVGASTGWPRPAATVADGRFAVRGTGEDLRVVLAIDDPRFARRRIVVEPGQDGETTTALEPARVILGRVTFGDNGRPVVGAAIVILGGALPGRWINSHELRVGDRVFLRDGGPARVLGVRHRIERTPVCNLTIRDLHSFAAGDARVLVHNECGTPSAPNTPSIDPNRLNHIFGKAEHALDSLAARYGSQEEAYKAVQAAANKALAEGKLIPGRNGVLPSGDAGPIIDVGGMPVRLIGGRARCGAVQLSSFSRKGP